MVIHHLHSSKSCVRNSGAMSLKGGRCELSLRTVTTGEAEVDNFSLSSQERQAFPTDLACVSQVCFLFQNSAIRDLTECISQLRFSVSICMVAGESHILSRSKVPLGV